MYATTSALPYIELNSLLDTVLPPSVLPLHVMDRAVLGPNSEPLPVKPENNTTQTPQSRQAHVRHDWWYISAGLTPLVDELGESIAPQIFIDSDANKDGACYRLI